MVATTWVLASVGADAGRRGGGVRSDEGEFDESGSIGENAGLGWSCIDGYDPEAGREPMRTDRLRDLAMSTPVDQIAPGSKVVVKVVKQPTNAAAAKTIVRLLSKDAVARKHDARLKRSRKVHLRQAARGGRLWEINVVKQPVATAEVGAAGTIVASLDVIKDLASVTRFIEVSPV